MKNMIDDFDTRIQPEETLPFLTEEDIDALAEIEESKLMQSAYDAGFYGRGEGEMPSNLPLEMQAKWLARCRDGERDERETADFEHGYERQMQSLYGNDWNKLNPKKEGEIPSFFLSNFQK